jgi:hypothetical protein
LRTARIGKQGKSSFQSLLLKENDPEKAANIWETHDFFESLSRMENNPIFVAPFEVEI